LRIDAFRSFQRCTEGDGSKGLLKRTPGYVPSKNVLKNETVPTVNMKK
jgi:hypothetical protein